jgi:hypothetical protein
VYLNDLGTVVGELGGAIGRYEDLMGPMFPGFAPDEIQKMVTMNALQEARMSETLASPQKGLEALQPPESLQSDHKTLGLMAQDMLTTSRDMDQAIRDENFPHVHLGMAEMIARFQMAMPTASGEYCLQLFAALGEGERSRTLPLGGNSFCPVSFDVLPGGAYGEAIDQIAKTFVAEFDPRASFPEGMTPEELMRALTCVQPAIIEVFQETLESLETTAPPPEFSEGHQIFKDYFSELLATAEAIDSAVEDEDFARVEREFQRFGDITEAAQDRLPDNYRPLVKVIFGLAGDGPPGGR